MNIVKGQRFLKVDCGTYKKLDDGIFCLNKPKNITSAQTLEVLKEQLSVDQGAPTNRLKLGHGGTLDSSATGVLVIGLGQGCKKLAGFLHGNKRYTVTGKFGEATDTYNDLGKVIRKEKYYHITKRSIVSSLENFKGKIFQVPPLYCALKIGGQRVSSLVSSGKDVVLSPRAVECHSIELMELNLPYFTMNISCGGGFYVRSLVHDLGIALGSCAHVSDLCRIQQGPFSLSDCLSFSELCLESIISSVERLKMKYPSENRFF